jgi:hypothetical protein
MALYVDNRLMVWFQISTANTLQTFLPCRGDQSWNLTIQRTESLFEWIVLLISDVILRGVGWSGVRWDGYVTVTGSPSTT